MCGFNDSMPLFLVKTVRVAAGSTIGFAASYMTDSRKEEEDFSEVWPSLGCFGIVLTLVKV
jgi:hypothetical protein